MNRLLVIATILMLGPAMPAQQAASKPADSQGNYQGSGKNHRKRIPTAEEHLKVLAEKLSLSSDQQARIKPILQELHDATQKVVQDESMSPAERMENVRARRFAADKKIREILNDEQKKKLDQLEQAPHPELHGDLHG